MDSEFTHGYKLAAKWKRLLAALTQDLILVAMFVLVYSFMGKSFHEIGLIFRVEMDRSLDWMQAAEWAIQAVILGGIFYPLFTGNIGHWLFSLKVISEETGEDFKKPHFGAFRELLKYFLSLLIIPIIWILWDSKNQNLYDKITRTLVVEKQKAMFN